MSSIIEVHIMIKKQIKYVKIVPRSKVEKNKHQTHSFFIDRIKQIDSMYRHVVIQHKKMFVTFLFILKTSHVYILKPTRENDL